MSNERIQVTYKSVDIYGDTDALRSRRDFLGLWRAAARSNCRKPQPAKDKGYWFASLPPASSPLDHDDPARVDTLGPKAPPVLGNEGTGVIEDAGASPASRREAA